MSCDKLRQVDRVTSWWYDKLTRSPSMH